MGGGWRGIQSVEGQVRTSKYAFGSVEVGSKVSVVHNWTHTRRLSSVRSTATPASTLPTVNETSIVAVVRQPGEKVSVIYLSCCNRVGVKGGGMRVASCQWFSKEMAWQHKQSKISLSLQYWYYELYVSASRPRQAYHL